MNGNKKTVITTFTMKNSTTKILLTLFLMLTIAITLVALPDAKGQGNMATYAFVGATPNPIGVGQEVLIHLGITVPIGTVEDGWEGLTVTVTRPDGTTDTLGPIRTDSTGGTGVVYVPTQIGTYSLQTHFPEQVLKETSGGGFSVRLEAGTVLLASESDKIELIVNEEPRVFWPGVPLPTEYWTRPIDAQLWEWSSISGSWVTVLGNSEVRSAPYNDGPETAHVLWTNTVQSGGLAGGEFDTQSYEDGAAYEDKAANRIIIGGVLYYNRYESQGGNYVEQDVVAVDVHTGEELWSKPLIGRTGETNGATVSGSNRLIDGASEQFPNGIGRRLNRGQLFYWDSYNYHGVFGYLWTVTGSTWMAFDALTGRWAYTIRNVPSGTTLDGPKGEIYRYNANLNNNWFTLWNSSALVSWMGSWRPTGNVYNASGVSSSVTRSLTNITIPSGLTGSVREVVLGDRVVGGEASDSAISSWAFSLKPGQEGQLLFNNKFSAPSQWATGNQSVRYKGISLEDGIFVVSIKETRQHYGFSVQTGKLVWGPTESQYYLDHYQDIPSAVAEGRLFSGGMSGNTYCYNVTNGELLWIHETGNPYGENTWSNNYPRRYPQGFIADGKYYSGYFEHSPIDPKPRGAPFFCVDLETGEEIWRLFTSAASYRLTALIGDSVITYLNTYDNRMYGLGKGPSAIEVSIQNDVITFGDSVLVKGMVTDVSPGTKDSGLTMRFPNGVPAVADESMSDWMQYVHMQFPQPTDVMGIDVVLKVLDPNNNVYNIGTATGDSSGLFSQLFTPDVPGKYTIIATFEGSEAYYGASAQTAIYVEEAPQPTPEPTSTPAAMTDTYLTGSTIAILAGLGIAVFLLLRKK